MIRQKTLLERLRVRKQELNQLDKAYCSYVIGDKQYNEERPILLGKIAELEDLCHITRD